MKPMNGANAAVSEGSSASSRWRVGTRVERELDGLWFPGTIVACARDGTFEVEYDEDQNREEEVEESELRVLQAGAPENEEKGEGGPHGSCGRPRTATSEQMKEMMRDSLLLQASDYDPNKAPTVVLHHRGETQAAASAYIINGLENNIAAGNGLRGIRWLRVNTL